MIFITARGQYESVAIAIIDCCESVIIALGGCCGHAIIIVKLLSLWPGLLRLCHSQCTSVALAARDCCESVIIAVAGPCEALCPRQYLSMASQCKDETKNCKWELPL